MDSQHKQDIKEDQDQNKNNTSINGGKHHRKESFNRNDCSDSYSKFDL